VIAAAVGEARGEKSVWDGHGVLAGNGGFGRSVLNRRRLRPGSCRWHRCLFVRSSGAATEQKCNYDWAKARRHVEAESIADSPSA
jgi:hypothetical protein